VMIKMMMMILVMGVAWGSGYDEGRVMMKFIEFAGDG